MNSYRLQLTPDFGFDAVVQVLPYLVRLGVTTVYTSPYFMAGSGSAGYDVCDHSQLQPELGGDAAFDRFAAALRQHGLRHLLDVVPNHMGADTRRNRWWRDVLQHGPRSRFAGYFDVDWDPVKAELRGRILLPILNKPYGDAIAQGDVRAAWEDGEPVVVAGSQPLPLAPHSLAACASLDRLTPDELHALLERQVYRLAYWRTASDEINYRRFFDVDALIGVRMEDEEVFRAAHSRVAALVAAGIVTGLRVDHPDGLARPAEYFARLRALPPSGVPALHIVAEKILTGAEELPPDWPVDGTTGYEFLNLVNGLFVDPTGAGRLLRAYRRMTGSSRSFAEEAYESRKTIMATTMASELHMLAHRLNRISERQPRSRDFTLNGLRRALMEIVACLPVYRTYLTAGRASAADIERVRQAADVAIARNRALEASVFRFITAVIFTGSDGLHEYPPADAADVADRRRFTERLQQFTGSVFAKGVEDTAFYRYQPLLSLNEVGGDPAAPGSTPDAFHAATARRAANTPGGLLATSTHDTKLGEDARARINVLSELPVEWGRVLSRWRRLHASERVDRNDVYRLFQALVGTYPAGERDEAYVDRLVEFMRKSIREAKRHTSWINQNTEYEDAVTRVVTAAVRRILAAPSHDAGVMFLRRVARVGVVNSLAQLALKIGAPGVVDVYQGADAWDLNLVDPDNRRPVDFGARSEMLDRLEPLLERVRERGPAGDAVRQLLEDWTTGGIKMFVTAAGLRLRRRLPVLTTGAYQPVAAHGVCAAHVVSFLRHDEAHGVLVAAPRLVAGMMREWPLGGEVWGDTCVSLPDEFRGATFTNELTGHSLGVAETDAGLRLADLLVHCPVAILTASRT